MDLFISLGSKIKRKTITVQKSNRKIIERGKKISP
jgi:hypothetical protein